jgi:hypothetical protein
METHGDESREMVPSNTSEQAKSTFIYAAGGVVYAVLCGPAIGQRGFPPIDPALTALTLLWPVPIFLATILDDRPFRRRLSALCCYSIATAFVNAASTVTVVPKQLDLQEVILGTIVIFGPLHLAIGLLLAAITESVRKISCRLAHSLSPAVGNFVRWSVVCAALGAAIAFPVLFRQFVFWDAGNRGRTQAERDWDAGQAVIYTEDPTEANGVWHEFDVATGLEYRRHWPASSYSRAYDERVGELLRRDGTPEWSMKPYLVPDETLVSLLDSEEFEEVKSFPHEVNDSITLFRRGTITRWGESAGSNSDTLSITTKGGGVTGIGDKVEPAYILRKPEYPRVIFIRSGTSWIGAYHESGKRLSSASRDERTE